MIISQLIGGLGNQMFQYAAGRALTLLRDEQLKVDVSGFNNYSLHQGFELFEVFNITTEIASKKDMQSVLHLKSYGPIKKILLRPIAKSFRGAQFIVEPHFHYWHGINFVPSDCYLAGYWQSEKYFMNALLDIRSDFTFKNLPLGLNSEFAEQISELNSVSLHVRRGDYANNPKTLLTHGLCSLDYYQSAIKYILEKVKEPTFFIFSDDIEWVKKHIEINSACHYISHNYGSKSYNDMRLMSLCKHNIIANSTFSWWGAWLNANDDKIVVAPKLWFAKNIDTKD